MLKKIVLCLFLFYFSIYFLTASGKNFYNTDASNLRLQVVKSIVERSDITVPQGTGVKGADGRDYSWVGIGSALLAIPFYMLGEAIGDPKNAVAIMNQQVGAITVVLVFLFTMSLGYSRRASLLVSVFYGLGTMAWPLAKQPFDHTIETFFILLSVYCIYLYVTRGKISNLIFSALSLGFAFITRPTSILVVPSLFILMIFFLRQRTGFKATAKLMARDIILFSIGIIPFLCLSFWYNHSRFGSIFETGYQLMAQRLEIDFFTGTSLLTGLSGFLVSPGKGFFYYSPVALLFFLSIRSFIKKYPELGISFILIIISYLLFLSKNMYWHGDWAWGPRYILVLIPFFIIPIAELFDSEAWQKRSFRRLALYSIFIVSFVIQIAAVSVDFQKYFLQLSHEGKIQFTDTRGEDAQAILVPTAETYFDWHKSPLLMQFKFISEITRGIKDYIHSNPPKDLMLDGSIKEKLFMNVYDYWWLYSYFLNGNIRGFIIAFGLFLFAFSLAIKLWKYSQEKL